MSKGILNSIFSNWVGFLVAVIVAFVTSPIVVHELGDETYGIWLLIMTAVGYMGLVDVGIRPAIGRYITWFIARKEPHNAMEIFNTGFWILVGISFLIVISSWLFGDLLGPLLKIPTEYHSVLHKVFILLCIDFGINLCGAAIVANLTAIHRFDLINVIDVSKSVLKVCGIFYIYYVDFNLLSLTYVTLVSTVFSNILAIYFVRKECSWSKISWSFIKHDKMKLLLSFGFLMFLSTIADRISLYTDTLIISIFVDVKQIVFFSIGSSLITYSMALLSVTSRPFYNLSAHYAATNKNENLQNAAIDGTRISLLILFPLCIGFWAMGGQFIELWMGTAYRQSAYRILMILCIGHSVSMAGYVCWQMLVGMGFIRITTTLKVLAAVVNLFLSIILAKTMGIEGVAWGTTIPLFITSIISIGILCRKLKMRLLKFIVDSFWLPFCSSIPYLFACYILPRRWPSTTWSIFSLEVVIEIFLFFIIVVGISLKRWGRTGILHKVQQLRKGIVT